MEIIEAQAAEGNVLLVGRGGQVVLGQRRDVLHVRITAPVQLRCATVQERCKVSAEVAAARVAASDAARAGYHKRHFGVRWDDESPLRPGPEHGPADRAGSGGASVAAAAAQLRDTSARPSRTWMECES